MILYQPSSSLWGKKLQKSICDAERNAKNNYWPGFQSIIQNSMQKLEFIWFNLKIIHVIPNMHLG